MGINLILKFKFHLSEDAEFRWARRIQFDGNGGLIIFRHEGSFGERLSLDRVHDLRIQPLPALTFGLECRA